MIHLFENKQKYIDALMSGNYNQTYGALRNVHTNCFCALGVVADLYIKETFDSDSFYMNCWDRIGALRMFKFSQNEYFNLNNDVMSWFFGLDYMNNKHVFHGDIVVYFNINDNDIIKSIYESVINNDVILINNAPVNSNIDLIKIKSVINEIEKTSKVLLSSLNDLLKLNFNTIADIIEKSKIDCI